ncbi:tyrosine-type recombinase/integrase [Cryptosporangium sp. NPDC051539]|uniref:tyrosine-type recombinase/integrase n=1 Tax=Cryptosporangium sp. NPDC051539 TaxID=3363962 RepID=UPI00378B61D4
MRTHSQPGVARPAAPIEMPLWGDLANDWARSMRARNLSANTIRIYLGALRQLADRVQLQRGEVLVTEVGRRDIEDWTANRLEFRAAGTVNAEWRGLQQFFKWLALEDEIDVDPFVKLSAPIVPEAPVPVLTDDEIKTVLAGCAGKSLIDRRDTAILRLLLDTGGRLAEIGDLQTDDVDQDVQLLHVVGKGRRPRALPYGAKASDALARYLRSRKREKKADLPWLWLAAQNRGRLEADGIKQMIARRGAAVGIANLHAHRFRHTLAHDWRANGGNETDLMRIMGWKSPAMLRRYGATVADERAINAHRQMRRGDRI